MKNKKDKNHALGHMTSVITSNDERIEKDSLSSAIKEIRGRIIRSTRLNEIEKLRRLLLEFNVLLDENCKRIMDEYKALGCPNVEVEPAIGYFIPFLNEQDAILKGAEPSVIVTAKDLTKEGLDKFLLAAGIIGERYSQDAEILKFPIESGKFDNFVKSKSNSLADETALIGTVTEDGIIPTFEIVVDIPELMGEKAARGLGEEHFENTV